MKGLAREDIGQMVRFFGRRMGLKFEQEAADYLMERYGGHPLLTRMACSFVHSTLLSCGVDRPHRVSRAALEELEEGVDQDLLFYCNHIVSELREFYQDEYDMLEMLASGQIVDFVELAAEQEFVRHIRDYGLISFSAGGRPSFAIPVVGRYLASEYARRTKSPLPLAVVGGEKRGAWCERRKSSILREARDLERVVAARGMANLYGRHSVPEAERFAAVVVCRTQEDFVSFINTMHRCFVEPLDQASARPRKGAHLSYIAEQFPDLAGRAGF